MKRGTRRFTVRCRHCGAVLFEAPLVDPQQVDIVEKHIRAKHRTEAARANPSGSVLSHIDIVER